MKICSFQVVCMAKGELAGMGMGRSSPALEIIDSVTLCHLQKVKRPWSPSSGSWQNGPSMVGFPPQPCQVLLLQELCQNLLK